MSLCPFATQKLLPESHTQPHITPRAVILHSAAGMGSLYQFFLNGSNLESHFWVSETGAIEQYMDTNTRADANLNANSFAVSIETESSVQATERWTDPQAAAIVRLVGWICDTHHVPRVQIPTWDGAGIGWHIMFGAPGPWTPHHKTCPGPARIVQTRDEIIPAVAAVPHVSGLPLTLPPAPPYMRNDYAMATQQRLNAWVRRHKPHGLGHLEETGEYDKATALFSVAFQNWNIALQTAFHKPVWPPATSTTDQRVYDGLGYWATH